MDSSAAIGSCCQIVTKENLICFDGSASVHSLPESKERVEEMRMMLMLLSVSVAVGAGCSATDMSPEEPLFEPGDATAAALPGTEHLYQLTPSPDGSRIALVRRQTPGEEFSPHDQLWIVNADGSDPRFIGVNVGGIDWSPDGETLALTIWIGTNSYVYTLDLATLEATRWSGTDEHFFTQAQDERRELVRRRPPPAGLGVGAGVPAALRARALHSRHRNGSGGGAARRVDAGYLSRR